MKNKFSIALVLILIVGGVLRLFNLSNLPPSLNWDEVSHGYNAYSILKTGMDEWGKSFPLSNFRAYGDYPLPLNLYLTMPFIAILGLSELSIRLPHAILGVLTILSTYFFTFGLTKRKGIGILSAFLVAIDPWTLFTSRFVLQSNLSVFLLTTSAALFFNRKKSKYFLPLSVLTLGLTLYSYHTTRIITPLIAISAALIYWKELVATLKKKNKVFWISLVLAGVLFLPLPYVLSNPESRARSQVVFVLNENAVNKIISLRQNSDLPDMVVRLLYNRPTYFAWSFISNYFDYFSPEFLFLKGGTQYQFSIPNQGLMQVASLPFFYIGLIWLVWKFKNKKEYQAVISWLFLAPIPASITVDRFAVLRSTSMVPLVELVAAIGFFAVSDFVLKKHGIITKRLLVLIYLIILALGTGKYINKYMGEYSTNYSWSWQYGYKEVVSYARENYDNYDYIIVTKRYGEPHEYFLFYMSYSPDKYRNDQNLIRFGQSNWFWVDRFDKFWFVNDWQVKDLITESKVKIDCSNKKCLLITSPENHPENWDKIETINFLDGKPAFEIYKN